jgi:CubicO group peptidase (beta-lactamase class C family)
MADPPGEFFEYSNCASYLIAAILDKATQKNGLDFANEKLFSPLGIPASQVKWPINSQGVIHGFGGVTLRPIDMAKFGFLYLHKGLWDGKQVISKDWVDASTKKQILTSGSTITITNEYGFQWWVTQKGYFMAMGFAGQYIIVNPSENLVVVFTSALKNPFLPRNLYENYILGAILSDEALSDDMEQQARLDAIIKQVSIPPAPEPVPLLPDIATAISEETFYYETNPYGFKTFSLTFTPGADEALYSFYRGDTEIQDAPIGLDNVYRYYLDKDNYLTAYKGQWENETTFVMNVEDFERPLRGLISRMTFEGSKVTIKDFATTFDGAWEITAEIQ